MIIGRRPSFYNGPRARRGGKITVANREPIRRFRDEEAKRAYEASQEGRPGDCIGGGGDENTYRQ